MKIFLEKQLTVKTFVYIILSLVILAGGGFAKMKYDAHIVDKNFAEYRIKSGSTIQFLSYTIDSLDKKYNHLYENLDNIYELNWKNVEFWVEYYEIENKNAAISQIAIESGNLGSNICKQYGNLVGMHYPRVRKTSAAGYIIADGGAKVATYDYWWKSIEDYGFWQEYFGYDEEYHIDEYLTMLDNHGTSGYAEASNYIKAVKRHHDKKVIKNNDLLIHTVN